MTLQHIYLAIKEMAFTLVMPAQVPALIPVRIQAAPQRINEDQFRTGPACIKVLHTGKGPF
jgi:hypothetical protein